MLATHLADHTLPEPASLSVTTRNGQSETIAQLRSHTVPTVAVDLLAWADTLSVVTVEAWRPPERDRVHLSILSTLTGPAGAAELKVLTPTATLPTQTVEEIVNRAGRPDFDRWAEQGTRCGHCSRPVRLRGRVEHRSTNGRRVAYSTEAEPDRVLLIRCGNRRAAACPSCSYEYAGDMWQLLYAGAAAIGAHGQRHPGLLAYRVVASGD